MYATSGPRRPANGRVAATLATLLVAALVVTGLAVPASAVPTDEPTPALGDVTQSTGAGNPNGAPLSLDCEDGWVLVGVRVEVNAYLRTVTGLCLPLSTDAQSLQAVAVEPTATTPGGITDGSPPVDTTCPDGLVVTGFSGRSGFLVDGLAVRCSPLVDGGPAAATDAGSYVGGPGGTPFADVDCPAGNYATGTRPRTGDGVDFFALACRPLAGIADNSSWPKAADLPTGPAVRGVVRRPGEALWYRFPVQPGNTVQLDLAALTDDLDLTVFRDIGAAFDSISDTKDLTLLSAEFAGDAYSPSAFSPSAFSPSAFSPSAFSPSAFSPSAFSPSAFSPSAFSPSAFSPSAFSPSAFSPSAFSPSAFSPAVSLPSAFSPSAFSPSAFSRNQLSNAFSSAQTRSLLAVSARDGAVDEQVRTATWNNSGYFYVRVAGRAASTSSFQLTLGRVGGTCTSDLSTYSGAASFPHTDGAFRTVLLTDSARLPSGALPGALSAFAARSDVQGLVLDAAASPRLRALNAQADSNVGCPYAKNLVAQELRNEVNRYRAQSPGLAYVVVAGSDGVVPFFRYADSAGLGPESDYVPPVADTTASQAALRTGQVLSQDAYGSLTEVNLKGASIPVPDLAVGRLVETPEEIIGALDRYAGLTGGTLPTPASSLVTGYDFLQDAADAMTGVLGAGTGKPVDTLVTKQGVVPSATTEGGRPDRDHSWTAADLRAALLGATKHDITYLAGHFSANSTLAADFATSLLTTDLAGSATDFANTLVISAGCHSGYTVVDGDGVPGVTVGLDWTQAFARKGATLVAGTGYQYGDTDFLEYSERLYDGFARQLLVGTGPVALGNALVAAKQQYLADTPTLTGIHQKAVLEATLYGLPMLRENLPAGRTTPPAATQIATTPVPSGPGSQLGLSTAQLVAGGGTTLVQQPWSDPTGGPGGTFTYRTGPDGVLTSPGAPALPLDRRDVSAATVLRGVGFRSGTYTDTPGTVPLTGAATTELNAVHPPFSSPVFYPGKLATPNYFGALTGSAGGATTLAVTPTQYRSDGQGTSTMRSYSSVGFQLLYSSNVQKFGPDGNQPALAAAPALSGMQVTREDNALLVSVHAVGDPSAGVQQVWTTYTAESGPWNGEWVSLDLTQDPDDSTLWTGSIPLGQQRPEAVRLMVQAANGVGLITQDDAQGAYYRVLTPDVVVAPSTLVLDAPGAGSFGGSVPVSARVTTPSGPVVGAPVTFTVGASTGTALTGQDGVAAARLPLGGLPGSYRLTASTPGAAGASAADADAAFVLGKQPSTLALTVPAGGARSGADTGVFATLTSAGVPLPQRSVTFLLKGPDGTTPQTLVRTTDYRGRANLGTAPGPGSYQLEASFGQALLPGGGAADIDTAASSDTAALQVTGPAATLALVSGNRQLAQYGTAFAQPLVVKVTDAAGQPSAGIPVTFRSPKYGAGTLVRVSTVMTGSDGVASLPVSAGPVVFGYNVVATVTGTTLQTTFHLVNQFRTGSFAAPVVDPPAAGTSYPIGKPVPLALTAYDARGPIADVVGALLAYTCRARLTSAGPNGTSAPVCMSYNRKTNQFVYRGTAASLGWKAGSTYDVTVTILGIPRTDVLGQHTVRMRFR